jgi:DNA sulfur modification protein DndC
MPPDTGEICREIVSALSLRYRSADPRPWIIGYSGGKDSTLLVHLVFEAIRNVRPGERTRPVFVLSSDTQVETPQIVDFVQTQVMAMNNAARSLGLPISAHVVRPEMHETFWVRLLGYGYPAPNRWFRWCTERLKIKPTNAFVLTKICEHGEVIILLGSRYAESPSRARSIKRHQTDDELNPHSVLKNAFVWAPIRYLQTEVVWEYLASNLSPWGGTHRRLLQLYREANAGECPLVIDDTTQPCGNSRFGCWTCTVVERDRSMEGFIASGKDELRGLAEFRERLIEMRDNPAVYREPIRRNGQPGNGPLKMEFRQQLLDRLLGLQRELGIGLISEEEVLMIRQVWLSDSLIGRPGKESTRLVNATDPVALIPARAQRTRGAGDAREGLA